MDDPHTAFELRVRRRLEEFRDNGAREFRANDARLASRGLASGARIRAQLDAIGSQLRLAIDWALSEAQGLPGNPAISPHFVWGQLQRNLTRHLASLFSLVRWGQKSPGLDTLISDEKAKLQELLNSEVQDYKAGVWYPRAPVPR